MHTVRAYIHTVKELEHIADLAASPAAYLAVHFVIVIVIVIIIVLIRHISLPD